ncbi:MAG TPA: VTT domain-containing protein [Enterovirga sp.]
MSSTPAGAPKPGRQRRAAPYAAASLAFALAGAAYVAGAAGLLDADALLAQRENVRSLAAAHPFLAMPAFMASYVAAMSLALPLGAVLGILAGLLFGLWLGTGLVVVAGAVSALAVFCLARSALGGALRRRAGPVYERLAEAMQANGLAYLLFLRLVPVFPFFVVNLVAAALSVRTRTFLLATLIGKLPSAFVYVGLGQEIGRVTSLDELVTIESLWGLAALGLLALAPVLYRAARRERRAAAEERSC